MASLLPDLKICVHLRNLWILYFIFARLASGSDVRIQFLPPPMEGTVSLGLYDVRGKLVRTLHRESEKDALTKEADGLVATWDGKDDAGSVAPSGKYRARGFVVGEIKVEGQAFLFNDWIDDEDSPRIRRIVGLSGSDDGSVRVHATAPDGSALLLQLDPGSGALAPLPPKNPPAAVPTAEIKSMIETPRDGASSRTCVFDGDIKMQCIRIFETSARATEVPATDEQKPAVEKHIRFSDEVGQVKDKLEVAKGKPFVAAEKIAITLRPNPLESDQAATIEIATGFDKNGSFLKSSDGLMLRAISETKNLRWVAIGRGTDAKSLVVFQSDGAVVEQFKISGLRDMMRFDAGEFDFDPAKQK